MVGLVEAAPVESAHLVFRPHEDAVYPIDHGSEICREFLDIRITAVLRHIPVDIAMRHPANRLAQDLLPLLVPLHIRLPLLQERLHGIGKLLLRGRHEGA